MNKIFILVSILAVIVIAFTGFFMLQSNIQRNLAPDFALEDLEGNSLTLSNFRGKIVLIDFMATQCGPCGLQISHLDTIWNSYRNQVVIISISIDPVTDSEEVLRSFKQKYSSQWIWARDTANVGGMYEIVSIPTTVIIDQKGYIQFRHVGVTGSETLIQEIEQLIK